MSDEEKRTDLEQNLLPDASELSVYGITFDFTPPSLSHDLRVSGSGSPVSVRL